MCPPTQSIAAIPIVASADSTIGMARTNPRPRGGQALAGLREPQADVVHLDDQADDPVDAGGDRDRDGTRIRARESSGSSVTSLSEITMISAEKMKSVRIAPLTSSSSWPGAVGGDRRFRSRDGG